MVRPFQFADRSPIEENIGIRIDLPTGPKIPWKSERGAAYAASSDDR
jgi:hypothetical protein